MSSNEKALLKKAVRVFGMNWADIARAFPGRSSMDIAVIYAVTGM